MTAGNYSIYLIDQCPFTRNALEFLLTNAGFIVHTAPSWRTSLDAYKSITVDLVALNSDILSAEKVPLTDIVNMNQSSSLLLYYLNMNLITNITTLKPRAFSQIGQPVDSERLLIAVQALCESVSREASRNEELAQAETRLKLLSDSEKNVLQLLTQGYSVADIAKERNTSPHTVQNQRASILKKMRARSIADAVRTHILASQNQDVSFL